MSRFPESDFLKWGGQVLALYFGISQSKLAAMRLFLILFLCLSVSAQSPKQHAGDKQNTETQADKPAVNQNSSNTGKRPETQFYTYNNQNSEGRESPSKVSDYLLAAFTLALVIVSFMQWKVLRKHEEWMQKHDANLVNISQAAAQNAKSARRNAAFSKVNARAAMNNASAAKRSADAIVNVERAWIMVDVVWEPTSTLRITRIDGGEGKKTGVAIRMICTNEGRMPAWITYRAVHVEVASIPTGQTEFLPSESSENYIPIAAKGKDESPWRSFGMGQPEVGKEVFIYGVIKYRDVFGPERETWFGYLADDSGTLTRIPQRDYNKHT
jgi:hypothetical protein